MATELLSQYTFKGSVGHGQVSGHVLHALATFAVYNRV